MKQFTDLEQSKKLAEFLPNYSADMYYQYVLPKSDKIKHNPEIGNPINALEWYNKGYSFGGKEPITLDDYCVPCWSLAALLDVINKDYYPNLFHDGEAWNLTATHHDDNTIKYDTCGDDPLDNIYRMIVFLHDQNLI